MEKRPPRYIAMQSLVGIWKLVEARAFDDAGHEVPSPLGPEPMGGLFVEAERIMVIVGDGRVTLPPDAPKRVFLAYSGPYTFDGTRYVPRDAERSARLPIRRRFLPRA
jgi:hypothetical protein